MCHGDRSDSCFTEDWLFLSRQSGSHRIYKNALGRRVTVPFHSGQTLHPKLIKSILTEAQLTVEEFVLLLQE